MMLKLQLIGLAALTGLGLLPSVGWTQPQQPVVPANPDIEEPASAPSGPPAASSETELEAEPNIALPESDAFVQPAAPDNIVRYSDAEMAISLPKEWTVEAIENGIMVSNVTTVPTELVATQIVSIDAPPGPVVNANIDSFVEEGAAVGRYRTVTIDGQSALVMWLSNRPDELSEAIATFIGYGNKTVLLFSRYSPSNETAEEHILQMHTSFSNLAIQTAAVEEPTTAQ